VTPPPKKTHKNAPNYSQYQPIWDTLKNNGYCRITAPKELHKRIIKAVMKRKNIDVGYKVLLESKNIRQELRYTTEGSIINFTLISFDTFSLTNL
jgi:hypothetical protein